VLGLVREVGDRSVSDDGRLGRAMRRAMNRAVTGAGAGAGVIGAADIER
jgi:hypothetical protein